MVTVCALAGCSSSDDGSGGSTASDAGAVGRVGDASAVVVVPPVRDGAAADDDAGELEDAAAPSVSPDASPVPPPVTTGDPGSPSFDSGFPEDSGSPPAPDAGVDAGRMEVECSVPVFGGAPRIFTGCNGARDPNVPTISWTIGGQEYACFSNTQAADNQPNNCPTGTACEVTSATFNGNGTCL